MKKRFFLMIPLLLLFLVAPVSAESPSAPSHEHHEVDAETISWIKAMSESHWSKEQRDQIPDEYFEWHCFGFYSSMGCTDISCTNVEHFHWCPSGVCQDQTHEHSEAEYREAARLNPVCPCHSRGNVPGLKLRG